MQYPPAYKWNIIEYPRKYDIIFHLGLPQEYAYAYSPRRVRSLCAPVRCVRVGTSPPPSDIGPFLERSIDIFAQTSCARSRRQPRGLYKIFFHLFLCMHESSIPLSPPPICMSHTAAILLREVLRNIRPPPTLPVQAIHHTRLAITISCKGQPATPVVKAPRINKRISCEDQYLTQPHPPFTRYCFTPKLMCTNQSSVITPPPHPHCPHYCTTIAQLLRNIRPLSNLPFVRRAPYNIDHGNIV